MAAKRDISWKRTADGLVLIRNNRWYRDDDLEVPQPLLRRWFGLLLQTRQQEAAAQAATPAVPQTLEEKAVCDPAGDMGLGGGGVLYADALADTQRLVFVPAGGERLSSAERRFGGQAV